MSVFPAAGTSSEGNMSGGVHKLDLSEIQLFYMMDPGTKSE